MSISLSSLNLYSPDALPHQGRLVEGSGGSNRPAAPDLSQPASGGRELAPGALAHQPLQRYTQAQLDMRPVDRADAALMAVVEPDRFETLLDALTTDGDWRSLLAGFSQQLAARPEWLEDNVRLPAARLLRDSAYLLDLSVFGR